MDWFLYDSNLRHERVEGQSLDYIETNQFFSPVMG